MAKKMSGVGSPQGKSKNIGGKISNPPKTRPKNKPAWTG